VASQVRLIAHPEFEEALKAAEKYFARPGFTAQFIEKDYYVTEALRIIASQYGNKVIFKGGTSLSKGWDIIRRFSEDIDIFLNAELFIPELKNKRVDNALQETRVNLLNGNLNLKLLDNLGSRKKGFSLNSYFEYTQKITGNQSIPNRFLLEMGTRSGKYPTQVVSLYSYLAKFLADTEESLGCEDEHPFEMTLLHFRRTFVEKLFAIHYQITKIMKDTEQAKSIGSHARHYYDLVCLARQPEVISMIKDEEEYKNLKQDCDQVNKINFSKGYQPPLDLRFSNSIAIFPEGDLREAIMSAYETQCRILCYDEYPQWEEVESCFEEFRDLL